ncbi:RNA polymerase sigma factor SigI [Paenibacillus glycanilyticus]|uniref:RNA polymerase sigma factor SigI n=1 Tax=Paenibacillus glycanilyticus TaxID=126569 RepID=A0ABQ6GDE8_9BACL|nr:RNA polymerase sigma factor SigI [Paenibacillus glycanilyticus]GLX67611.1 RNA polymerase sigma factor SigI [Paenibacillus glycanilyticus]
MFKRFLRRKTAAQAAHDERIAPEQIIKQIQEGDEQLREKFIADYKPYVAKVTSGFSKRYVDPTRDDEFSVALTAFNEAITQFSPESGRSFLSFAETVMRRRLIDYVRKEQRHLKTVPYTAFDQQDEEEQTYNPIDTKMAMNAYQLKQDGDDRRLEIEEFSKELQQFQISFMELAECSPKHADSRQLLQRIAQTLAGQRELFAQLYVSGKLPVKELTELCGVSRKTVERNRKYIIAISLIVNGTYPYLYDYLNISIPMPGKEAGL